jgi:hypothetical protein
MHLYLTPYRCRPAGERGTYFFGIEPRGNSHRAYARLRGGTYRKINFGTGTEAEAWKLNDDAWAEVKNLLENKQIARLDAISAAR